MKYMMCNTCIPWYVDGWVNSTLGMCLCIRLWLLNSRFRSSSENSGIETSGIYLVGSYCTQGDVIHDIHSWLHCPNLALCIKYDSVLWGEYGSCRGPWAPAHHDIEIAPFLGERWSNLCYGVAVKCICSHECCIRKCLRMWVFFVYLHVWFIFITFSYTQCEQVL